MSDMATVVVFHMELLTWHYMTTNDEVVPKILLWMLDQ